MTISNILIKKSFIVAGVDCPGGEGKFGFNSYDLLTFAVLSFNIVSNVITNTNKNENNNNNNDNQVSIQSLTPTKVRKHQQQWQLS